MTDLKIEISPEDVKAAISQAINEAMKPEVCEKLVKQAVAKLLEGTWNSPSELQRIFNHAVSDVARQVAEKEFEKPENKQRLVEVVAAAWEKTFSKESREPLVDKVASAIATAIAGRPY